MGNRFIGHIETPHRIEEAPASALPAPTVVPRRSRKGLVAASCSAAVLSAALAGWWLLRPRTDTTSGAPIPLPLTSAPGWEIWPRLSPDGNQVAYAWDQGKGEDKFNIFVKVIGEGKPLQLTSNAKYDLCPSWSPDGHTIAFVRFSGRNQPATGVYTIPALGGAERQVAEGGFVGFGISWSPDGRFLAVPEVHLGPGSWSVALVQIENGEKCALTKPPDAKTADYDPAFSPDGRKLLFTPRTGDFHCGLYLLALSEDYRPSGEPMLLRQERGDILGATWTADGREVVYAASDDAAFDYHLMRIRAEAGSQPQRLTFAGEYTDQPAIAARGNRLLYRQKLVDIDIWQVHPGEPPRSFISSTRSESGPQYSPDGQQVAFESDRTGRLEVWVCDADGANLVQLTHLGASGTPRWSPDGHWIAFDHQEKDGWRIYVMASDGGQLRRLAEEKGDAFIPSLSGDGKWIYYTSNATGRYEICRRPAQGGPAVQLTHNGGFVAFESRDGQSLYYSKVDPQGRWSVWVLPLGGGQEKQVLKSVQYRNFAVVDDGLYYMPETNPDGSTSVRFHSFASGQDTEISPIKNPAVGLTVSPDRKTILFATALRTGSNIMVVDKLR